MNQINLIGRATANAELKFIPNSGTAVLTFTLATPRKRKKEVTEFIDCVVWGKQAEGLAPYVTKGKMYGVVGELQSRSWDAKDGSKRKNWEVIVDDFTFCGDSDKSSGGGVTTSQSKNYNHSQHGEDIVPIEDDSEIPF